MPRQPIYSRLAGDDDVNDAEALGVDPALRSVVGGRAKDTTAASTSERARFEAETRGTKEDLKHRMDLSGRWIDQAHRHRKLAKLLLGMGSAVSATYGPQQGSADNGHVARTCYQPLLFAAILGRIGRLRLACASG